VTIATQSSIDLTSSSNGKDGPSLFFELGEMGGGFPWSSPRDRFREDEVSEGAGGRMGKES